jgi:hypothetical protein
LAEPLKYEVQSHSGVIIAQQCHFANCHISTLWHFSVTTSMWNWQSRYIRAEFWQFAVKECLSSRIAKTTWFLRWYMEVMDSNQLWGSGSGSLMVRSGSLKELREGVCGAILSLGVKLESEFGKIRRIWEPDFTYIDVLC